MREPNTAATARANTKSDLFLPANVGPKTVAALLLAAGVVLHVAAALLLLEYDWSNPLIITGAAIASILALVADALFGIALQATGWDSVAIRAMARSRITNTATLRARLAVTHTGRLNSGELQATLRTAGITRDSDREITFQRYKGTIDVEDDEADDATHLNLVFETQPHMLRSLEDAIEGLQDVIEQLISALRSPSINIHNTVFSLSELSLEHWQSPITDVEVLPTGASWSRQLKPHESRRLRQYLQANVDLSQPK